MLSPMLDAVTFPPSCLYAVSISVLPRGGPEVKHVHLVRLDQEADDMARVLCLVMSYFAMNPSLQVQKDSKPKGHTITHERHVFAHDLSMYPLHSVFAPSS